jgi:hypothetical protein
MRDAVKRILALGEIPPDAQVTVEGAERYEELFEALRGPATAEEVRALVPLLRHADTLFGLLYSLIDFVESCEQWPLEDCLGDETNWWAQTLRSRARNAGFNV